MTQQQGWHTANWGIWGWAETGLKLVGIGAGIAAFLASSSAEPLVIGGNPELGAVIVAAGATLFTFVALGLRFTQKEIISMAFAIANTIGHTALLVALLRIPEQLTLPIIFGVAFVLGELTKQRFLTLTGYTEAGQQSSGMLMFSRGAMGIYALLVVFLLI